MLHVLKKSSAAKPAALLAVVAALLLGAVSLVQSAAQIEQLLSRAYLFASLGMAEQAANQFVAAANTDPANVEARLLAGLSLQVTGKPEQAAAMWREAEELGEPAATVLLGDALYSRGDIAAAEAAYQRALAQQPESARALFGLAAIAEQRGQLDAAISYLKKILAPASDSGVEYVPMTEAYLHLGRLYATSGRVDDALPVLSEGVRYNPEHAELHYWLGTVHEARGSLPEAVHAYERALQLDPSMSPAAEALRKLTP